MSTCACLPSKATKQGKPVLFASSMSLWPHHLLLKCASITFLLSQARVEGFTQPNGTANLNNLCSLKHTLLCGTPLSVGLWNCQSTVNKADFIIMHMPTTCHLTSWLLPRPGLSPKTMLSWLHFRLTTHSLTRLVHLDEVVELAC